MNAYYNLYTTTINGETYHNTSAMYLAEGEEEEVTVEGNWTNLKEIVYQFGIYLPFNVWTFKKGQVISFFDGSIFDPKTRDIKEWKRKDLSFTLKIECKHYEGVSINKILDYRDGEKAIKYLLERGIALTK